MMNRFDTYVKAIWKEHKLWGFVVIVLVLAGLAWLFKIDVAGGIQTLVNWNS